MRANFGRGSWTQPETLTWEMWYPLPPFHAKYENEPGLMIRLSPADANDVVNAIGAAATTVGVATGVGAALAAFSGVVSAIVTHLVRDGDGGMTIHIAPHGFQVGNVPAADPNWWVNGAWSPVAAMLWKLPRFSMLTAGLSANAAPHPTFEIAPPNANSRGRIVGGPEVKVPA